MHIHRERNLDGTFKYQWRIWWGHFHVEFTLFRDAEHTMLMFRQNLDGEPQRMISIGIKWLFCLWFGWSGIKLGIKDVGIEGMSRAIGIRIFDGKLWFDFWGDPDGWGPRREWCIHPIQGLLDLLFGKTRFSKISEPVRERWLHLPEGYVSADVTRYQITWKRPRLPFAHKKFWRVDIEPVFPIPIPGKGESSWDLDDDAIYEQSIPIYDISAAMDKFVEDVIKRRLRYGGYGWRPDYGSFQPLAEIPD